MKPGAGKRKGSSFEREFCKALSIWWTDGRDKDVFWRTHSSGARHGIQQEAGDVMAIKPEGNLLADKLLIELKCWRVDNLLLDLLREDKKSMLEDAWIKCIKEAEENKKMPLLVVKITNRTTICLSRALDKLCDFMPDEYPCILYHPESMTNIMPWDKFLEISVLNEWKKQV